MSNNSTASTTCNGTTSNNYLSFSMSASMSIDTLSQKSLKWQVALQVIYVSLSTLQFITATICNLLTIETVLQKTIRITSLGVYLIVFSFASLIGMIMLYFRIIVTLFFNEELDKNSLIHCRIITTIFSSTLILCLWTGAFVSIERVLIQLYGYSLYRSRKYAILISVLLIFLTAAANITTFIGWQTAVHPIVPSMRLCKFRQFSGHWKLVDEITNSMYIHYVIPLILHVLSTVCVLIDIIRHKIILTDAKRCEWSKIMCQQLKKHKSFFIPPIVILIDVRVPPEATDGFADFLTSDGVKIEYVVHIADIGAIIERQRILHSLPQSSSKGNDFAYDKYHTVEEIHAWVDQMVATYPEMATSFTVGKSYENRDMKGFKISSTKMATKRDGTKAASKKAVWWDGGIHAREWISPATVIYIAYTLLSKYGQDPTITHLVDQFDYYILPVFNVDGYAYTWTKDRLWRKTRSKTSVPLCYGADPNRNWDYHWCESGASHDPCSDTFCGEKVFSEIETAQVAKFITDQQNTIVHYINFHSYSQLWMSPWGYTTLRPPQFKLQDDGSIQAVNALRAVHGTQYQHGTIAQIIYVASGSTADWTYGVANVTFSYGVELRDTGKYGFLLPEDQIIPTGEETMAGLVALLQYIEKQVYA
ncbi:unnamed protein product [Rotaria sp. Silwood1]|nr:unnamed protein product [Rotaria sp. Silwood1]